MRTHHPITTRLKFSACQAFPVAGVVATSALRSTAHPSRHIFEPNPQQRGARHTLRVIPTYTGLYLVPRVTPLQTRAQGAAFRADDRPRHPVLAILIANAPRILRINTSQTIRVQSLPRVQLRAGLTEVALHTTLRVRTIVEARGAHLTRRARRDLLFPRRARDARQIVQAGVCICITRPKAIVRVQGAGGVVRVCRQTIRTIRHLMAGHVTAARDVLPHRFTRQQLVLLKRVGATASLARPSTHTNPSLRDTTKVIEAVIHHRSVSSARVRAAFHVLSSVAERTWDTSQKCLLLLLGKRECECERSVRGTASTCGSVVARLTGAPTRNTHSPRVVVVL